MENDNGTGFVDGYWYPHKSFEGGTDTIAYGHKIKDGEDFSKGLTESEALKLLIEDLSCAEKAASLFLKDKHGVEWSELPEWKREIFIDFQFNGVLRSFPKFVRAVICDDVAGIQAEYKRYAKNGNGIKVELKARNSGLQARYLVPLGIVDSKD
jgi:hypothetical protein